MRNQTVNLGVSSKNGWGLGLFSVAVATLLVCVWSGQSLGTLLAAMVLGGLGVGGLLVVLGSREEKHSLTSVPATPTPPSPVASEVVPPHLENALAEIAVLGWKIEKRAQKEQNPPKPILRNAARILELLDEHGVSVVSYEGRKIDAGSRVERLEGIEDEEEGRVVAEHEPEIQVDGRLAHRAILSIGTKRTPQAP